MLCPLPGCGSSGGLWGPAGSEGLCAGCDPAPVRRRLPWPAYQLTKVHWAQADIHLLLSPADRPPLRAEVAVPQLQPCPGERLWPSPVRDSEMALGLVCGVMSHLLPFWLFLSFPRAGEHRTSSWALWTMGVTVFSSSQPDAFLCWPSVAVLQILWTELGSKACCFFRRLQGCYWKLLRSLSEDSKIPEESLWTCTRLQNLDCWRCRWEGLGWSLGGGWKTQFLPCCLCCQIGKFRMECNRVRSNEFKILNRHFYCNTFQHVMATAMISDRQLGCRN